MRVSTWRQIGSPGRLSTRVTEVRHSEAALELR